ncbi:glycoside hydrolase family 15 protein [Ancylobacter sp. MQZ15Z-1]|uniref:Trehalase n=1 Tax=Ancylobacter mangrovi TaxID=2972472 RepID=A0A9X2T1Z1_9HYPH|nr:glycoside hydrolase family 15 protein [Ancylobacter mangrovi]MCS0495292.1 glycoside hydrolase family 15 protein [Ancylobacter mangrovi]
MTSRIEDYALIGDCETAALVSRDGAIDWACFPRFDSPACFAALLGTAENGRWSIAPADPVVSITRRYRPDTLILETTFETAEGRATLIDFMPPRDGASDLVRLVVGVSGRVAFDTDFVVRFDYGRTIPWVTHEDGVISAVAGPDLLTLVTPVPLDGEDLHTTGSFTVHEGDRIPFVLTYGPSNGPRPAHQDVEAVLADTETYWREFIKHCPEVGQWTETVKRSLITLKALTYHPSGGIVAAATTSLPEQLGGSRNWDYRFCWLRDATMTLMAFMKLGYYEEASAWREWLMRAIAGAPAQVQIMYGVAGERQLLEWEVPWLAGYEESPPVRIGNAAAGQFQLDVYGEVADAMAQALKGGLPPHPRTRAVSGVLMPFLERAWLEPDEGIWEMRGGRQHFTYSKVMAWVAFDRAAKMAEDTEGGRPFADHWRQVADAIHADVCAKAFDPELDSFVQAYGSKTIDASVLQIPLVGFLPVDDPRVRGTVAAVEKRLLHDGLVLRYRTDEIDDGLPPGEGAFLACSFWLADVMVLQGRYADARRLFGRLREMCNDVGLLAEEYDPVARRMLGNFPQAFSHVGLINTALNLARATGPAEERAEGADGSGTDGAEADGSKGGRSADGGAGDGSQAAAS